MQTAKNLEFKFRYVQNKQAVGLTAGKATASDRALNLNGEEISYGNILDTSNRDNRLVLLLAPSTLLGPKSRKRLQENVIWSLMFPRFRHSISRNILTCSPLRSTPKTADNDLPQKERKISSERRLVHIAKPQWI